MIMANVCNYNSVAFLNDGKSEVVATTIPTATTRKLGDQCLVLKDSDNSNKPTWYVHDGSEWVPVWKGQ